MEDVLAVYSRPYNKAYPVACMDEKTIQFLPTFAKAFDPKTIVYNTRTINTSETEQRVFSFPSSLYPDGDMLMRRTRQD